MTGAGAREDALPAATPGPGARLTRFRERRRRGANELGRLKRSDAVLFSPGNSGRTWLRVMLTRVIEQSYGLQSPPLVSFDNLHKLDARIPVIAVTHNRWLPYVRKPRRGRECRPYYSHRVLMLLRNPIDTCVSQYFQWKHRSKDYNILLKGWPPRSDDLDLPAFLDHPDTGVARLCRELDTWLRESAKFEAACVLRYEDMLTDPGDCLERAVRFFGIAATEEVLSEAVAYGAFDNMKQREAGGTPVSSSPEGQKARVGKVCGYVDYLAPRDCERYASLVAESLSPAAGYAHLPEINPRAA